MKELKLEINGKEYVVSIESFGAHDAEVIVNGNRYTVGLKDLGIEQVSGVKPQIPNAPIAMQAAAPVAQVGAAPAAAPSAGAGSAGGSAVKAPLPGQVLSLKVKVGDSVTAGQTLLVMEAMKMENEVEATSAGTVKSINVGEGDTVSEGDVLVTLG